MKKYEALFIFPGSLKDEALQKIVDRIRDEIANLKGNVQDVKLMGKRTFSRPLKTKESGQYARIGFSIDPGGITPLLAKFKLVENIFRVQIIRKDDNVVSDAVTKISQGGGEKSGDA